MLKLLILQERAASQTAATILQEIEKLPPTATIELALADDDYEASQPPLGWPTVSAQVAMFGRLLGKLPSEIAWRIVIVFSGITSATALAEDQH